MNIIEELQNEIKNNHPSICYDCVFCRKTWSDELRDKGYCGCGLLALEDKSEQEIQNILEYLANNSEMIGTGWVALNANIFLDAKILESNGMVTNDQLITYKVKSCKQFKKK